jgi:hypothetical protein
MSSSWIRKWVLAAALAVMPLHGIAATLTVLVCHGDAQTHATHASASHGHDESQHHAAHQHGNGAADSDDGSATGSSSVHLCCNLTASAPPSMTVPTALPAFPVQTFVLDSLHDLFFPDQPQRPPLA